MSSKMFKLIEEKRLLAPNDKIELVLKNFGKGRETLSYLAGQRHRHQATRGQGSGDTKIKFGSVRAKKSQKVVRQG